MPTVPLLASIADLSASVTSGGASQLVPSGVVMAFAGATAPTGWLLCEGALINRTTYADLFAAIGTAHGSGDGSTTFALPNYAGRFIRGRANGSANDPNRTTRTAAAAGGATGDAVGSVQTNATAKNGLANASSAITAQTTVIVPNSAQDTADQANSTYSAPGFRAKVWNSANTNISVSGTAAAQTITGDSETRPLNAYVNYIIKI
jgi:microcystin-dependent protein